MRVVNDKQETTEPSELGFLTIAAHAVLSAFGIASVFLGPLPMILAHVRLADPWPKVTALLGAVLAIVVLEVPLPLALVGFIVGLFVADGVWKQRRFWPLLQWTVIVACLLGAGMLALRARLAGVSPGAYWTGQVDAIILSLQESFRVDRDFKWDVLKGVLLYEGPFFYLSGVILSLWLSIGLAAHMGWLASPHAYSGESLRALRLPYWASLAFGALLIGSVAGPQASQRICAGLFRVAGCVMFIQGSVCLSEVLYRRDFSPRVRTLIYCVAATLGFYALVGMGAMSPLMFRRPLISEKSEEVT